MGDERRTDGCVSGGNKMNDKEGLSGWVVIYFEYSDNL